MRAPPGGSVLVAEALGTFLFFFVGMGAVVLGSHTGDGAGGLLGVALANGPRRQKRRPIEGAPPMGRG